MSEGRAGFSLIGKALAAGRSDLIFMVMLVAVIAMLVIPIPAWMIDGLIAFNIAFAIIITVSAISLRKVLDLSTFPAVILVSTVFRVALTVSTTRLVLADGDAGAIISGFGHFVVAGNLLVGLVIFLIIAIVQFIVVTKGAERVAEVAARFTLDGIPGKQLSIDSDLRNGHISREEALSRRSRLERESQFFGAMDGAMRFVKGDAIAALVIVAINLIGGLAIGVFQHGMSFAEASNLYSLLSIGDGLAAQIPSMLSAVAAGIVVTRIASDDETTLGQEIGQQFASSPKSLSIAAAVVLAASLVPGFPTTILLAMAFAFACAAYMLSRRNSRAKNALFSEEESEIAQHEPVALDRTRYGDPLVAAGAASTLRRLEADGLGSLLQARIKDSARRIGIAITVPTFAADNRTPGGELAIYIENVPIGVIDCSSNQSVEDVSKALSRLARYRAGSIFGVHDAGQWLESLEPRLGKLVTEVQTKFPDILLVSVIRRMLEMGVPLSQPRAFLEMLVRENLLDRNLESLAEKGRRALRPQLIHSHLSSRGMLPVVTLGTAAEASLRKLSSESDTQHELEPSALSQCVRTGMRLVNDLRDQDDDPVFLVAPQFRSAFQQQLNRIGYNAAVLSYEEIQGVPTEVSAVIAIDIPSAGEKGLTA
jgi:type III secretion protein V